MRLPRPVRSLAIAFLVIAVSVLAASPPSSSAQFIACKIVNLNPSPPATIQAGQPFQITTKLTVSCDLSVLPIIRVSLRDATSSDILSTTSVPYPSAASFVTSVVNQATARQLTGSWALKIEVDVISGVNGQSFASTSQLFQVNVEPYTSPVTLTQTIETTIKTVSVALSTTQTAPAATAPQNSTQVSEFTQLIFSTQLAANPASQLLIPAAIILLGVLIFGLLIFAGHRRDGPRPLE